MTRVLRAIKYQTIIISDSESFIAIQSNIPAWNIIVSTISAYIAYLLPTVGLLFFFWAGKSDRIVCGKGENYVIC